MTHRFKPIKCKFCRKAVFYDMVSGRVYETENEDTPHVQNCERRQQFYKSRSAETAQAKRSARADK